MGKERIILAFIAIVAGLLVATSLFSFYQQKKSREAQLDKATPAPSSSVQAETLTIESPENESITDKKTVEIKGKTQDGTLVVITTAAEDFVFNANSDGTFSQKINLANDENLITVTAYPDNGMGVTKELTITYSQEEF